MRPAALLLLALTALAGCTRRAEEHPESNFKPAAAPEESATLAPAGGSASAGNLGITPAGGNDKVLPGNLGVRDTKIGNGREAKTGDTVTVHYSGFLLDGTKFDSSRDRNEPFKVTLGHGEVIKGWDQGIPGMKVGGQRTLIIPPELAYGARGSPPKIKPHSTLKFDIELLRIQ